MGRKANQVGIEQHAACHVDAVHETFPGMRLKAWVAFQQLVPLIEKRLASGAWPKPVPAMVDAHPAFAQKPRQIALDCRHRIVGSQ